MGKENDPISHSLMESIRQVRTPSMHTEGRLDEAKSIPFQEINTKARDLIFEVMKVLSIPRQTIIDVSVMNDRTGIVHVKFSDQNIVVSKKELQRLSRMKQFEFIETNSGSKSNIIIGFEKLGQL